MVKQEETTSIYCLEYTDEKQNKGYYIGQTKPKIKIRVKERKRDVRLNKDGTAFAQLNQEEIIKIDFDNPKID